MVVCFYFEILTKKVSLELLRGRFQSRFKKMQAPSLVALHKEFQKIGPNFYFNT